LSHARSALKDKFHAPTVPLAAEYANRQVFLPDPVDEYIQNKTSKNIQRGASAVAQTTLTIRSNMQRRFIVIFSLSEELSKI
jgi:hypothetical protein